MRRPTLDEIDRGLGYYDIDDIDEGYTYDPEDLRHALSGLPVELHFDMP